MSESITAAEADQAIGILCAYRDQDPTGCLAQTIEAKLLKACLVIIKTPAAKREPGALARPLPDDLGTLTLVQTTIHDNWRQDTKPRGRPGKNGKRPRQTPTRYGLTVQAWDQPEGEINMASGDWQYHLNGDLLTADEFMAKALDLMNYVPSGDGYVVDPKRRNAVTHPISEDFAATMIAMANEHLDPSYRFAFLKTKGKGKGTWVAEFNCVRLKLTHGLIGPKIEDAVLVSRGGALHLPAFLFSPSGGGAFDPRSNAVAQSRFAQRGTTSFERWRTK